MIQGPMELWMLRVSWIHGFMDSGPTYAHIMPSKSWVLVYVNSWRPPQVLQLSPAARATMYDGAPGGMHFSLDGTDGPPALPPGQSAGRTMHFVKLCLISTPHINKRILIFALLVCMYYVSHKTPPMYHHLILYIPVISNEKNKKTKEKHKTSEKPKMSKSLKNYKF